MYYSLFRPFSPLSQGLTRRLPTFYTSRSFSSLTNQQTQLNKIKDNDHHHLEHVEEYKGLYNMPQDHSHHGDPRKHLNPDGTYTYPVTSNLFHFEDTYSSVPKQHIVSVDGVKMIKGIENRSFVELFSIHQLNIPFFPRKRMNVYGHHDLLMKAEFLFFWTPTFIIWSLTIPVFTMLYMVDEAVYTAMTVKVIGRQWYWIYEVESPTD